MNKLSLALVAAFAAVPAAHAATYGIGSDGSLVWEQVRFYEPGGGKNAQYVNGQPTYYGTVSSDKCAGADRCGEPMAFDTKFGGKLTATAEDASGYTNGVVIQDLDPDYGGLGVLSIKSSGAVTGLDDINSGDRLTLTFTNKVRIVGFHFWDKDHNSNAGADDLNTGDKFGLSVDGGTTKQLGFGNNFPWYGAGSMLVGKSFSFSYVNEDYYLGAIKIAQVAEVPEPGTYGLLLAGLVGVGFVARRRRGA